MSISPADFQRTLSKYQDFHRLYLFQVVFYNSPTSTQEQPTFITELIASTETPVSSSSQLSVGWMGSKIKVAGKTDFQDWKVTVRDDLSNKAFKYFQTWREEVYNLQDGSSESLKDVGYKRTAAVQLLANGIATKSSTTINRPGIPQGIPGTPSYSPTINTTTITANQNTSLQRIYTIHGIWPKDIGAISLDYSTENIATFPVTFSIDYYTYEEMIKTEISSIQTR